MKHFAACTAALFAAPLCMVAQAADVNVFVDQTIDLVNSLSDILNKVTPENAGQMDQEILALKPKADELKKMAESMSDEDNKALESNPEATAKLTGAMMGLFAAMGKLQSIMEDENTTPEQKAAIQKLGQTIDSVMSDDDEHDDEDDEA
ncbi:MAG: hypothetical protein J1E42_00070 [Akkermansiaceae bacterium]|nr:hypothetical protein [Akkermansiaceae bacterium]